MWKLFNTLFEAFKKFPLFKWLYKLPWAPRAYHFSIAVLGGLFYPLAGRGLWVIGITGTKGKTTTAKVLGAILEQAGYSVAILSSIDIKIADTVEKNRSGNTMPGRFFVQQFLRRAKRAGCDYAIIEVTSEGTVLHRHRFIGWDVGVITNISPEHIESHGSFEAYRNAKLSFLKYVAGKRGVVLINADDKRSQYFADELPKERTKVFLTANLPQLPDNAKKALPGEFNRQNIAAAFAVARHFDIDLNKAIGALKTISGIPGRMEYIQKEPFAVVVDYAHTPDSLEAAYKAAKPNSGRLICVLGSAGGHRDKWKRPEMGRIAEEYCDSIVLTNEDPWGENPEQIIKDIFAGISQDAQRSSLKVADRTEAIRAAIGKARKGDAVIITGKGSEEVMRFGDKTVPWSDKKVVQEALGKSASANAEGKQ